MFSRERRPSDFNAEVEAHIALEADRLKEQGLSEEEARMGARRAFGNVTQAQERFYESGRCRWWDELCQDVRYGLRQLRRNAGFTLVAVLTLALGIGASTVMFSVIECSVLNPLPYAHSHRMAAVVAQYQNAGPDYYWGWFPAGEFLDFRAHNDVFEQVVGTRQKDCVFTGREEALDFDCLQATGNFFQFTGVRPFLGRTFTPADAQPRSTRWWRCATSDPWSFQDHNEG